MPELENSDKNGFKTDLIIDLVIKSITESALIWKHQAS